MKIIGFRAFQGRNIYSHKKVIRMDVNLEGFSEVPSKNLSGFNEKLLEVMPELLKHRCGIDIAGGFAIRLEEGTYFAHICEHMIIALQNLMGIEVCYGKAREVSGEHYYVIYQYEYENTAIECGKTAVDIINRLINNKEIPFEAMSKHLKEILKREEIGPSTKAIIAEAAIRNIPVLRIGDGSMFQLGYGKYSKKIEATIEEGTGAVAVDIACDKLITNQLLSCQCIPIAKGREVESKLEISEYAKKIGFPVVLKPRFGNQGKGVFVNLKNEAEAFKAFDFLKKEYSHIMLEEYICGRDYRICVVNNKVVAVAERIPPFVIGDGINNIYNLIEAINMNEKRGEGHEKPLTKIVIDDELLSCISKQGYDIKSIPEIGIRLVLRQKANLSTGGASIDCTDLICEENKEIAIRSAKVIGLDICGIDVCCSDIGKSIDECGAVIEVNAAPGIRMHQFPWEGKSRNVAASIVDMMFNEKKRIPLIAVTGTNGKTTTSRLIAHVLNLAGYKTGFTTTGGIYIGSKCIEKGDTTGYDSAMGVLMCKDVEAAVLEVARGGLIRRGLAYDRADVGVITNITEDHLGLNGIETIEEMAYVKSLVVEAVRDDGYAVINADDPISASIIPRIKSKIIMFSKDKLNTLMRNNLNNNGIAIYAHEGFIYVEEKENVYPIAEINNIKITFQGKLVYNVENAMAACAALIGIGIKHSIIRKGITSFYGNEKNNPGRFNMYEINGVKVVLDYGHNIEGYRAVLKGALKIDHKNLIGVIGVPGDRKNTNVLKVGNIAGENFDYIYIKEDQDRRGRKVGEIADLLEIGVLQSGFPKKNIKKVLDEKSALEIAIENAKYGDLIIIFFEKYEPLLQIVKNKILFEENKKSEKDNAAVLA
jgi:cyanophycin synthetase